MKAESVRAASPCVAQHKVWKKKECVQKSGVKNGSIEQWDSNCLLGIAQLGHSNKMVSD